MEELKTARFDLKLDKMNDILEYMTSIMNRIMMLLASINRRISHMLEQILELINKPY